MNGDYEYGATDAQLIQQVMCALATTLQLFRALADRSVLRTLRDLVPRVVISADSAVLPGFRRTELRPRLYLVFPF